MREPFSQGYTDHACTVGNLWCPTVVVPLAERNIVQLNGDVNRVEREREGERERGGRAEGRERELACALISFSK